LKRIRRPTASEVSENSNPFALSIGDLMAALLLIFVLLLSSTLMRLQDEFENKTLVAERYTAIKADIYRQLMIEFKDDLLKWNATIDSEDLVFRFKEPDILFGVNESSIKPKFKEILNDFFPRYINVISRKDFKENIEEIRIEGHTDNSGPYFYNMELSQDRTRSVLTYVLQNTFRSGQDQEWVKANLTANGLSYSRPIADNNDEIGKRLNRRVEFRIRTNAEKQIEEILNLKSNGRNK
jgi:outer membrane protein OmpA-like peptidoglycan-associated protein